MASGTPPNHSIQQAPQPGQKVVGSYVLTQKVGKGSFATVWRGHHKLTGQEVAVKAISRDKLNRNKLQENLESEIAITKKLAHKNIVKLFDIQKTERHIYLILEYCNSGDLSRLLKSTGQMPEQMAHGFMVQLARGLQFLRSHNLIHRDLKPQNLLLKKDGDNVTLKIADFGFARYIQPQSMAETLCGSPLYMAPEILKFQKYDAKADLWSVGTILFQLVAGRPPFQGQNHVQLLQNIEKYEAVLPSGVTVSRECQDLLQKLLKRNPIERLSFEEFFMHPFLVSHHPAGSGSILREPSSPATTAIPVSSQGGVSPMQQPRGSGDENVGGAAPGTSAGSNDHSVSGSVPIVSSHRGASPTQNPMVSPGTSFNEGPAILGAFAPGFIATSPATGAFGVSPSNSITANITHRSGLLDNAPSPASSFKRESIQQTPPQAGNVKPPRTNPFKDRRSTSDYGVNPLIRGENEGTGSPVGGTGPQSSAGAAGGLAAPPGNNGNTNNSNSAEDFVFILSGSDSDKQTDGRSGPQSPAMGVVEGQLGRASPSGTSLEQLQAAGNRAISVAETANEKADAGNMSEALVLHVKALDIIHGLLLKSQQYQREAMLSGAEQAVFGEAVKSMQAQFSEQLERAKKAKEAIDVKSSTVFAEKLIYDRAMELGKDAAVDELLSNHTTARSRYTRAIHLLEQLLQSTAIDSNDRDILSGHICAFNRRMEDLARKSSPGLGGSVASSQRRGEAGFVF